MPTAIRPEIAVRGRDVLGECPVWFAADGALRWIDSTAGRVHALDPSTARVESIDVGQTIGSIAPTARGGVVAATGGGFSLIDRDGHTTLLAEVERDMPGNRMNDGKCDSRGRYWAGSWTVDLTPQAALYRLNTDHSVDVIRRPVTCSNGIGWSPDDRLMYYVDSTTYRVDVYDYDPESGGIRARPPLVEIAEATGMPDGLAVDADGCVWLCLWGGSAVHRYDPHGRLDTVVELPAANVTCCAFGGADLRDLYITTAREDLDEAALAAQPDAGSLFVCRPGVSGLTPNAFAG
ncbi:MAG TPA: SMP-30/gluconolactonase/LRE family protein [Candidatus Dormibacteraeota bacterium]|nr:SMP-30/gluconolactonase/LRE family protein [Candidatus Dormibacteraeota bacterium]